ncbi:tetratricopeptide repeat protein [Hydrogenophaga sp. RWCD_12]|uniref:tetratricopeptide repeat protein n=1 Tax=Hydrogenophaga sp. RWCD_12 TaxID=3391190 RepID=UPI0039846BA6
MNTVAKLPQDHFQTLHAMTSWLPKSVLALVLGLAYLAAIAEESPYNKGVEAWRAKDYVEARKQWAQSLAEGGSDLALNNLAYLLYTGLGGEARPQEAVELWRKGAALSVSEAQWHLGQAYEAGKGVEANKVQAYAWYLCAVATASLVTKEDSIEREIEADARRSASQVAEQLSLSEQERGKEISKTLIARYSRRLSIPQTGDE